MAAHLEDKLRLQIDKRTSSGHWSGADRDRMRALIVGAVHQEDSDAPAPGWHFTERDFLLAVHRVGAAECFRTASLTIARSCRSSSVSDMTALWISAGIDRRVRKGFLAHSHHWSKASLVSITNPPLERHALDHADWQRQLDVVVAALIAIDEILQEERHVAPLLVATPAQFPCDVDENVLRPFFCGVKGHDSDRAFELPVQTFWVSKQPTCSRSPPNERQSRNSRRTSPGNFVLDT